MGKDPDNRYLRDVPTRHDSDSPAAWREEGRAREQAKSAPKQEAELPPPPPRDPMPASRGLRAAPPELEARARAPWGESHSVTMGYILWIFGFTGAHRFYFGRPVSGFIWLCTLGLLGVGWLIDVFLIPGMDHDADTKYVAGPINYNVAWLLLTFLGPLGLHRFYMGKFISGAFYLLTLGWLYIGVVYDFFTLNGQVSARNREVLARD